MIRRVAIQGYKSLKHVEVEFSHINLIFGPNAAGKSNMFDALALLSRLATTRSLRDAFSEQHRGTQYEAFSYGPGGLDELLAQPSVEMTLEVDVEIDASVIALVETQIHHLQAGLVSEGGRPHVIERFLRYRVSVELRPETGVLRVKDEYLTALRKDGRESLGRKPFIGREDGRLRLRGEGAGRPMEPGDGLPYTLVSTDLYAPHYPHVVAFREELKRWQFYYLEPDIMRANVPIQDVQVLDHTGELLAPFYYTLKQRDERGFESAAATLGLLVPLVTEIKVGQEQGIVQLLVRESGVWFSARQVSEGTLRVLGLLAMMSPMQPVSVVGFEEPENGVHPRRLALIARLLAGQAESSVQYIINTHSPLFMSALLSEMQHSEKLGWLACRQDESGSTIFEAVTPGSLDERAFTRNILEGAYGG